MLKSIENSFLLSTTKVKLQLFVLPLFCIYFYIYFYTENYNTFTNSNKYKIDSLLNKKFNNSFLPLTKEIESYCTSQKIKIDSINYKNKSLTIEGNTTLLKIKSLMQKIERINNYSKIKVLSITKIEKKSLYNFEINTEFKKYYIKDKEEQKVIKKRNKPKLKLKAIVSNYILLNNKWYTINEIVLKHKIISINKNSVVLKYKDKKLSLKLHKDE